MAHPESASSSPSLDSSLSNEVTVNDIVQARERIESGVPVTPCVESLALSELCGCTVFAKLEYLHRTGSFKERGARNALMLLNDEQRKRGVIAASAGNHALALAFHGRDLGIPVTVVMPTFAPMVKRNRCRQMGATVLQHGRHIIEAREMADELVRAQGLTYIHGFDDAAIIAGQGTLALEVLEQVPDIDAIVVPIGGAGLIAGVALALKARNPEIEIIGVEPENCPSFRCALDAGKPVPAPTLPTLADGLAVPTVGPRSFAIARSRVDRVVLVNEEQIALAILRLAELEKGVIEGAGATPLAAFLSGQLDDLRGQRIVLCLCGGNIDPTILTRIIEHGLVVDGRLSQFTAIISDRPGGLAEFAHTVASTGASVKQISHERAFHDANVFTVRVVCTVETEDFAHIERLHQALAAKGIAIVDRPTRT